MAMCCKLQCVRGVNRAGLAPVAIRGGAVSNGTHERGQRTEDRVTAGQRDRGGFDHFSRYTCFHSARIDAEGRVQIIASGARE